MASSLKNLSDHDPSAVPDGASMKIGMVVSEWNDEITAALLEGAKNTLLQHGVLEDNIQVLVVPGSFELPYGAKVLAERYAPDAVICLGCVIQGETRHFDYICQGVTQGITSLNLQFDLPFVFGVLTADTLQQARDRAGGKYGNKGDEAAVTALKMVAIRNR